jgi:hypothetical protein
MDKISLAITTFNRTDLTIASFIHVMNNSLIDEIVIVDDHSDIDIFDELRNRLIGLSNSKIELYRNDVNLKPFLNKYEAVKKCHNDWLILLDSDNIIDNTYFDIIKNINAEDDMLYCPMILRRLGDNGEWNFGEFNNLVINKENVGYCLSRYNEFETFLNAGNYLVNRKKYMDVIENNENDSALSVNDALYLSYLWLLSGNRMLVVSNLGYTHRIHKGSWYQNNYSACGKVTEEIKRKLRIINE